jgi:hypothetical protein
MSRPNLSFRGWNARDPIVIDPHDPRGMGVCDGCSFWQNHRSLRKHMVYRGGISPVWDGMLFCAKCYDVPNPAPQFSRLTLYPDPVPLLNPRPQVPAPDNGGYAYWVTEDGKFVNTLTDEDTWGGEFVQTISDWEMTQ